MGFLRKSAEGYMNRGLSKYQSGDIEGARKEFNKSLSRNPNFPEAYFRRGACWQEEKNYDCAISDYTETIKLDGNYAAAYVNRGGCWQLKGDQNRAIKDFEKALKIRPNDVLACHDCGISWQLMGEYDRSIEFFNLALEINPHYALSYYGRCGSWTYKGEYEKALKDAEEAQRLQPDMKPFLDMADTLRGRIQEKEKWDTLFTKALHEIEDGSPFRCGPYSDCAFVMNAEDHVLVASWGFFNPFGPTYESLCVSKIPSIRAHFVFLKMSNPFSESSTVYSVVSDPIDNSVLKLVLEELFSANGGDIPIFKDAPSFVVVSDNSLVKKDIIKGLFYKAFKAANVVGIDNKSSLLKKHWCDPWKRSAVERDIGWMLAAKEMGKLDIIEDLKRRTDVVPDWKETKINENGFTEWWSLVTDPEHIKVEMKELPNAWQGSIGFQNENTTNPLKSTSVEDGLKFHYHLYQDNCRD